MMYVCIYIYIYICINTHKLGLLTKTVTVVKP